MLLGQLARLPIGVGDDHVPGERPLGHRLGPSGRAPVGKELLLAGQQPGQVGGGAGHPIVGEGGGPAQRDLSPAPDPDRGVGPAHRARLEAAVDGVVGAAEGDPVLGPERLHHRELLLEPRAPLLERGPVQGELVRLVADGDAEHEAPARHDVEHRRVLGEPHRVVERRHQDVGAEAHAAGAGREAGQHRQG